MKIAITGAAGYLGSNLKKYFNNKLDDVYCLDKNIIDDKNFVQTDFTDYEETLASLKRISPQVVIHTAALSSLAQCEKDHDLASNINIQGVKNIIKAIKQINPEIKLVFISSDYVFDGENGDYKEEDDRMPKTFYGQSKKEAEDEIKNNLTNYIICRTAAIYGRGGNFFNFLVDSFNQNKEIEVFDDVFYTPTHIDYLIDSLAKLIEKDFKGDIHIAGQEKISRYQFALKVATALGKSQDLIKPIQQPVGGLIAKDSSLNSDYVKKLLNNFCPNIDKSLKYCFNDFVYPYFSFIDDRGKLIGISQDYSFQEINYIESVKDSVRGGHYHKITKEGFYIIDGRIKIKLHNLTNDHQKVFFAERGDFFIVEPQVVHTFEILENSRWINMLSLAMKGSEKDIYKF